MTWTCECGEKVESRSKYILHKGICKTEDVNPKKSDLGECSFQDNLKERGQGDCDLPITEEPFSDLILNIEGECIVDSEISITINSNDQTSNLVRPTAEPIVVENLVEKSQGEVLPIIDDEPLSDVDNIFLEVDYVVGNTVIINTTNCEQRTDQTSSLEKPTTVFDQLISDTPQVS